MAADAIGHREQGHVGQMAVLVVAAYLADVGGRAGPQLDHFTTSITVLPTWRRSPRRTATGAVTFLRFRDVPFVDPSSSTTSWPSRRKMRACSWLAYVSSTATWQPAARPTVTSSPRSYVRPFTSTGSTTFSFVPGPPRLLARFRFGCCGVGA